MIPNNVLIYDIETETNGNIKDIENHKLKVFGAYSYKTKQYYTLTDSQEIQILINSHKILVGFNNYHYDNPVLISNGFSVEYKSIIDLYKVIKTRAGLVKMGNTFLSYILKSYSLDVITKTLGLVDKEDGKKELDYKLLDKQEWTDEERDLIFGYTKRDIEITKKLFEWLHDKFDSWGHHINPKDAKKLKHLSCASSVYTYKVLAEKCGFEEEYGNEERQYTENVGGYVSYPAIEKEEGNIFCMDFASLYPFIMIMCNLYGRNKKYEPGWDGNNKWEVRGTYKDKKISEISKVLLEIYNERRYLKKNKDEREYGLKICLNTIYGILRNATFKNTYDEIAGNDCCLIGQQWIKFARQKYKDAGYSVLYTDTDSVYIKDTYSSKEKILKVKDEIIKEIKDTVPFPSNLFDMKIDYEIDMIHFFKGGHKKEDSELDDEDIINKELGLMKKNYLFIYKDKDDNNKRKMFIKNLGIVKRNNTELSKKIFWDKMVPQVIENNNCKFPDNQIKEWIQEYLEEDFMYISKRLNIGNIKQYKTNSSIQAQTHNYIPEGQTENLGEGIHFLIPNKKIGFGKGFVKYCTLNEFNKYLTLNDIDEKVAIRELRYFNENYISPTNKKIKIPTLDEIYKQKELW